MQIRSFRGSGEPARVIALSNARDGLGPDPRRASGPAAIRAASTGRTRDRTRPMLQKRQKVLARAPSTRDPRADLRWRRVSVEAFVAEANLPEVVLRKLMLAHEHAAELLQILRRENVSRSALTPTMDNVSKDVWKWLTR